jgi:hypothetical protein
MGVRVSGSRGELMTLVRIILGLDAQENVNGAW